MAAVAITRMDMNASDLRLAAKRAADARQASRILAIAMVLDGFSREDAARLCGMDRQTLRDWVHRYNQAGLDGLADRARSGRPASLSWVEQGKIATWVEEGADLARDGVVRFRRADLRDRIAAELGVDLHERSVGKLLRRLGYRRLSVRPRHPQSDPAAQETFKKTLPS
jgi:transposase